MTDEEIQREAEKIAAWVKGRISEQLGEEIERNIAALCRRVRNERDDTALPTTPPELSASPFPDLIPTTTASSKDVTLEPKCPECGHDVDVNERGQCQFRMPPHWGRKVCGHRCPASAAAPEMKDWPKIAAQRVFDVLQRATERPLPIRTIEALIREVFEKFAAPSAPIVDRLRQVQHALDILPNVMEVSDDSSWHYVINEIAKLRSAPTAREVNTEPPKFEDDRLRWRK